MNAENRFNDLYEIAKKDPNILGFFLSGSRSKGFQNKFSDYDVYFIVEDNSIYDYQKKYPKHLYEKIDLMVLSLTEFKELARWGHDSWLFRYEFAHLHAIIDKNGEIQKIIDEKARIPKENYIEFIEKSLDGYINYVYRSIKCIRDGNFFAARLEASFSIPFFFDVIFAIHERRIRPYYKYLKWEMEKFPLNKLPLNAEEIIYKINRILDNADLQTQQDLLRMVEKVLINEGFKKIFTSWEDDFPWMKSFKI
ncbi:MAG: hypothetical protein EAX96_20350 [Candidatus Lokiarchaeota archaeon]|nr:hypothetical protein [Candidatus Lokiarchaeota archaeon]